MLQDVKSLHMLSNSKFLEVFFFFFSFFLDEKKPTNSEEQFSNYPGARLNKALAASLPDATHAA